MRNLASAYMLAAAAFGPLYGKLSNMFGKINATSSPRDLAPDSRTRAQVNSLLIYTHLFGMCIHFTSICPVGAYLSIQFGSAMCGAAQNMTWLIVCRAIQGIGGGGIIQLVMITISDIVPLKE